MPKHIRLGVLTPSSNTALEPLTQDLVAAANAAQTKYHITVHFSRFPVTTISLSPVGLAQFDLAPILFAAELLAHAEVDVIGWSGTSAGWLGFDRDVELCEEIEKRTGARATTSVLGLNRVLELWGVERLGLVTPYMDDVQAAIVGNYAKVGIHIGDEMEKHLRVERNCDIAEISEEALDQMVAEVAESKVDAITTFCTNLVAAQRVGTWESEHGVPVFDTVTTVVWDMLRICGVEMEKIKDWGKIFEKS